MVLGIGAARAGRSRSWVVFVGAIGLAACSGAHGATGNDGRSCTVADNRDGTMTVSCTDGTNATVARGADGAAGMSGSQGADGNDGKSTLVAMIDASPEQCPHGGKIVQVGLDDGAGGGIADDGILQPGEIEVTTPICNGPTGSNGYNSLVAITDATTAQCPTGGKAIGVGIDNGDGGGVAGDGILQAGEIDSSTPVCNGGSCRVRNNGNGTSSVLCDDGSSTTFATGIYTVADLGSKAGCGVRADGSLACWGVLPSPPSGTFRQVAVGGDHACALRQDGGVSCWGDVAPFPLDSYELVSTGGSPPFTVTCGVKSADRTLMCWGPNLYGAATPPAGAFLQVGTNGVFSCGLRTDRTLTCWGTGTTQRPPPSGTFTKLSVSDSHACALRTNGTAACWGVDVTAAPTDVTFSDVAAGYQFSCGVRADSGTIVCWGSQPAGPPPAGPFVSVTGGEHVACGVRTSGSVVCWGSNADNRATPPAFP